MMKKQLHLRGLGITLLFFVPIFLSAQVVNVNTIFGRTVIPIVWVWDLMALTLFFVVLLLLFLVMELRKASKETKRSRHRTKQLEMIMHVSRLSMWLYDVHKKTYTWLDRYGVTQRVYSAEDFIRRLDDATREKVFDALRQLISKEKESVEVGVTTIPERNPMDGLRDFLITFSVLRYEEGQPSMIIAVCKDVTEDRIHQKEMKTKLMRYQSVFKNVLVDMVFFDKDGYVVNMNQRMERLLHMTKEEALARHLSIKDVTEIKDLDVEHMDYFHATRFMLPEGSSYKGKMFDAQRGTIYELRLVTVKDNDGKLLGIYGTGRDMTEMVRAYQNAQHGIVQLKKSNQELIDYVQNINYAMNFGGVRMVNYSPSTHLLTIYKELDVVQYQLTQTRCITLLDDSSKKKVLRVIKSLDSCQKAIVNAEVKTVLRVHGKPLYLNFSFAPVVDENGEVTSYVGKCNDTSEMRYTERLLAIEKSKAQEVENLKNAFLRNMSYEIRTPLNVVVGFAELFNQEHSPEDENVFIQEIKDNSAFLLRLINDILFLSRLDAHMIEIKKERVDFKVFIEARCQMTWSHTKKLGVEYVVEDSYEQLEVEIDENNLGRVIEQIVNNAVYYTESGYVRARYDYLGNSLVIVIEDTGCGMTTDQLAHVYDRFATSGHGTGLGVPICQMLMEQMGGTIAVTSHQGIGTQVLLTLPCQLISAKRNRKS